MRKFLFSIFCATLSFLLALAPSAQAQSKSDAEALKKAKEAEEAAKKEAAKRAKEAEKAAKKAREQEEATRKAERLEAEQKARARDEALRRARAAAAAAYRTGSKPGDKVVAGSEDATRKAQLAEQEARKTSTLEAEKRTKAVDEARKAAELAREAAKKADSQESARKAKEAEEAAKHEAAVRAAQEKEVAETAKKNAEQLRKLNQQQEAERKAKEAELARKEKAEKAAAQKAQAEEAARQARLEAEARKARAAEEAAARELEKETARREKAQEIAARAQAREEAARRQEAARREEELSAAAKAQLRSAVAAQNASISNVAYEGETFRIVKVTKDGSASVVTPTAATSVSASDLAAEVRLAEAKAKAQAEAEQARQAKAEHAARLAREEAARLRAEAARNEQQAEAARSAREAEAAAKRAATRNAVAEHEQVQAVIRPQGTSRLAPGGRAGNVNLVPPSRPEPMPLPARIAPQEEHSIGERIAAAQVRAKREDMRTQSPTYATSVDMPSYTRSRSGNSQARYYEELWEKELAARAGKQAKSRAVTTASSEERRIQARYYEELWRKEQESKSARAATQTAQIKTARDVAAPYTAPASFQQQEPSNQSQKSIAVVPQDTAAAKEAELKAEKARLNASIEASRKTPETASFRQVQLDTRAADQEAIRRAEEDVRKARAEEEAARKSLEQAAAKKATEDARMARAQEEAARKTLEQAAAKKARAEREAMALAEEEAAKKARAEEAARRAAEQEAAKRTREQRSTVVAAQVQAGPAEKEGFWARLRSSEKPKTPAPNVSALLSDEERLAQDRALEALRQKQAELDAQDAQLKSGIAAPAVSVPVFQAQPVPAPAPRPTAVVPTISPEEAAKEARALAASNAELQSLKKKLANATAERQKVAADIQTAQKELSTPGAAKSSGKKFEVIVDNNDARLVGTWAEGKTGGFYGKDYSFKGKGTGANYADFTPNLPAAGTYEVYEWHVAGANRAADAPYIVNYDGGSQVVSVNQQLNGGKWNSIGSFAFAAGQNGSVRITDGIGLQGQMVMADAIRFVLVDGAVETTGVVDNSAREKAIEALRIKQDALTAEESRLKNQVQAAEKRIAALENAAESRTTALVQPVVTEPAVAIAPPSEAEIQARAAEALRRREAELNAAEIKPKSKKLLSVKNGAQPEPVVQEPVRPLTAKEQKLADLLRRYKADEITPRDYHQERAKILAEP